MEVLECGDGEVPLQQGVVPAEISYCGPTVEVTGAAASDQWEQVVAEVSIRRRETVRWMRGGGGVGWVFVVRAVMSLSHFTTHVSRAFRDRPSPRVLRGGSAVVA